LSTEDIKNTCDPIIKVGDLWANQRYSLKKDAQGNRIPLDDEEPATPCGLVAKSLFNDTFKLYKTDDGVKKEINIIEKNIAWSSDITYKFKNVDALGGLDASKTYEDVQWQDMTDEHFIVWMRTAGLPNFRKLWGRIDEGLEPGTYVLEVSNQYRVEPFQGSKSFVLSTTNALGGKNYFLAVCYITVGTLCMLFAFVFCVAYMKKKTNNSNPSAQ